MIFAVFALTYKNFECFEGKFELYPVQLVETFFEDLETLAEKVLPKSGRLFHSRKYCAIFPAEELRIFFSTRRRISLVF